MKKVGILVLTVVLGLSANGVIFAKDGLMMSDFAGSEQPCAASEQEKGGLMVSDRAGLMVSDRAGLLISDFVSMATASATGIIIVGKSGLMMSDFTGETTNCQQ